MPPKTEHPRYAFAFAGYLLVALALLAPLLPVFASAIPGGLIARVDGWQNVWNLWWTQRAVAAGHNPFETDLLFYPEGATLYLQTLSVINGLLALPVTALWGPTAGYNTVLLVSAALTGLAGYGLGLLATGRRGAAFCAGLLLVLAPFHLTRIYDGQLELAALHWPALATLFFARTLAGGRRRDALLAGLLLACTGLSSWYYLIFLGPPLAVMALLWPVEQGWRGRRRLLGRVALAGATVAVLLLPVALPALATAVGRYGAVDQADPAEVRARSANLLDPLLPSYLHPLWGGLAARIGGLWHPLVGDWNGSLGYGVLVLAGVGAARAWPIARPWLGAAAAAFVLALGPELHIGSWATGVPMPYTALGALPGLSAGRRPLIFLAVVAITLIPPAAIGLRALLAVGARRPWLLALILALLIFELVPGPWPLNAAAVHPYFNSLAADSGAVIELPPGRYKNVEPQRSQIVHGRPIVGGYLARSPRYPWPEEAPAVRALWRMRREPGATFLPGGGGSLDALAFYGLRDVVVRWDQIRPTERPEVEALLAETLPDLAPVYSDEELSAFKLPAGQARPFAALSAHGWHPEEREGERAWRWMEDEAGILIANPLASPMVAVVSLRAQGYGGGRAVALALNAAPLGTWAVGAGPTEIRLRFLLPPGEHRLTLRAATVAEPRSGRALSIVLTDAQIWAEAVAGGG